MKENVFQMDKMVIKMAHRIGCVNCQRISHESDQKYYPTMDITRKGITVIYSTIEWVCPICKTKQIVRNWE